jgi:hypothetical protein
VVTEKSKSFALLLAIVFSLFQCGRRGSQVEKTMESGVEVVINHLEPYALPGVPSTPKLEEILSIDTEKDEVLKTGLTSIETFSLDRDGNIYFMMRQSPGNFIYKFDASGKFLTSFGRSGQGPGEFEYGGDLHIDGEDRIIAKDMTKDKFFVFNRNGVLLEEVKLGKSLNVDEYLGGGRYLTSWQEEVPEKPVLRNHYYISNGTLSENQEFYTYEFDNPNRAPRYRPKGHALILGASDKNIYVGDDRGGYEIFVLDFSGKLLRRIRKDFLPVALPEDYKVMFKKVMGRSALGQDRIRRADFPAHLPPFQYLFADDKGRLYVMTNECQGERKYWHDIFSSEGAFIGRVLLDNVHVIYTRGERYYDEPLKAVVKGDRLCCLREKDSGFMVLTIYKMTWN